jgi:predicted Zn finger-like uncharacterized protein
VIVTCERCATQFRLDDAKVPQRGVRVRCSRCKHAFFVESPGGVESERVHRVAEEAVTGRPRPTPDATQDLCVPAQRDARAAESGLDGESGTSESDWEFGDDFPGSSGLGEEEPGPRDGLAAAREAVDDLLGPVLEESRAADPEPEREGARLEESPERATRSSEETTSSPESTGAAVDPLIAEETAEGIEEDIAEEPASDLALESDPSPLPGGDFLAGDPGESGGAEEAPASEFGEVALPEGPSASELGEVALPEGPSASEFGEVALPEGPSASELGEPAPPEGPSASELGEPPQGEELENPDAWDFFGGSGGGGDGDGRAVIGSVHSVPASTPKAEERALQRAPAPPVELAAEASARAAWLKPVANGAGWVVTAGLCLAVLYGTLMPGPTGLRAVAVSQRLAGVEAASLEGRWLENAVAGPIYVIQGALRRTALAGGPLGAQLEVQLLDAGGAALEAAPAAVGPAVPVGRLREQDPRSLAEAQEQAAQQLARARLAPGQRLPFHAVFAEVPPAAKGFRLRVHSVPEVLDAAEPDLEAAPAVPGAGSLSPETGALSPGGSLPVGEG